MQKQIKYKVSWNEVYGRISVLDKTKKYYGVPRGGQIIAGLTGNAVDTPEQADIIIDDLYDSGETKENWEQKYPHKRFICLFDKTADEHIIDRWVEFPWEVNDEPVEHNITRLKQYYNLDKTDTKLIKTILSRYEK